MQGVLLAVSTALVIMSDLLLSTGRLGRTCREISDMLRTLVVAYCAGSLDERGFSDILLRIEEEKVRPAGFVVTVSNTIDDWTLLLLRVRGRSEPCAAFEFLPGSSAFRPFGAS
jgi:hypothetical protein